ncbi:hypothetical protein SALBM217S_08376 [Streptomyces griseoloalbus]
MTDDTRVTLITGGGTGIGAAVARRLLEAGEAVAVTGRRRSGCTPSPRNSASRKAC